MSTVNLRTLVELATNRRLAALRYQKDTGVGDDRPRLVEPYNITPGQRDLMLRCYQIQPDEGWRFFMVRKIKGVQDGGEPFQPRVKVTISPRDIRIEGPADDRPPESDRVAAYRTMVSDALADDAVTKEEFDQIRRFVASSGLTNSEMQFVHASLFHSCLGAIIEDGCVDANERAQIRFLHKVLRALGWGVIE